MSQLPMMICRKCEPQRIIRAEAALESRNTWFYMREHTAAGGT